MRDISRPSNSSARAGASSAPRVGLLPSAIATSTWAVAACVHFGVGLLVGLARPGTRVTMDAR